MAPLGLGLGLGPTLLGGAGASSFAEGQIAPDGTHWEFVTYDLTGESVIDDVTGTPVVALVGN